MNGMTAPEMVAEAKEHITETDAETARARLVGSATVIDVREPAEHTEGHIPGAVNIPRGVLEFKVGDHPALADPAATILVYCKSGGRAALATRALQRMGFSGVFNLAGGYDGWCEAGMPTEKDPAAC
jgi:rhodanese-related sulfurtransferase